MPALKMIIITHFFDAGHIYLLLIGINLKKVVYE